MTPTTAASCGTFAGSGGGTPAPVSPDELRGDLAEVWHRAVSGTAGAGGGVRVFHNDGGFGDYLRQVRGLFWRHLTPRKALNVGLLGSEYLLGRSSLRSRPLAIKVESSNRCNLRCPLCRHGEDPAAGGFRDARMMSLDTFRRILDEVHRETFIAILHHKGEPFLNKDLPAFCAAARDRNIATMVSSHFGLPMRADDLERLVEGRLSYLTVSIDGATQEVYEQYRVGGRLEQVLNNVRRLLAVRRRAGARYPLINWQFIPFGHNVHEVSAALRAAERLGVDHFTLLRNLGERSTENFILGDDLRAERATFVPRCKWLWSTGMFLYDGEMVQCCYYDWDRTRHFGNPLSESFGTIWNGRAYRNNRRLVTYKATVADTPDAYCARCPVGQS